VRLDTFRRVLARGAALPERRLAGARVSTDGRPEFKAALMSRVVTPGCGTPAPNRAMPGPTASSSACRARFSRSSGAWPSGAVVSPRARSCNELSMTSGATTTPSAASRLSRSRPHPRRAGLRCHRAVISFTTALGAKKVSIPFRVWTPQVRRSAQTIGGRSEARNCGVIRCFRRGGRRGAHNGANARRALQRWGTIAPCGACRHILFSIHTGVISAFAHLRRDRDRIEFVIQTLSPI
jgi:hypothetical protein